MGNAWKLLIANGYNYDGTTMDNKIAKSLAAAKKWEACTEIGTPGNSPSGNNGSSFSALPDGIRDPTHIPYRPVPAF